MLSKIRFSIFTLFNRLYNFYALKNVNLVIKSGNNLEINGKLCIKGNGEFVIGNDVIINSDPVANLAGGNITRLYSGPAAQLIIGDNVGISNSNIISRKLIRIGKNSMIGANVSIYDTDFHSVEYNYRMNVPDNHVKNKDVIIGEGVLIGAHSIILKGVTIGNRSVIGAGSVVTKDIPPDEMWVGNPVRFVKKLKY